MTREKTVLCFGDSNTWGYVPLTAARLCRAERWPGVLQLSLGPSYHVIEEGLNGRATAFEEPFRDGRNARATLLPILESHAPLDLLIIMLGTNDLKHHLNVSAHESARGISALLQIANRSDAGCGNGGPNVLVVAPPRMANMSGLMAHHFGNASARSADLASHYKQSCVQFGCGFVDSNEVVTVADDGVHLDVEGHRNLALFLVPVVKRLIGDAAMA